MSYWAEATREPNAKVKEPKVTSKQLTTVVNSKTALNRIIRKTPAMTSVEEWINAEAGVGASIASGNHTCEKN